MELKECVSILSLVLTGCVIVSSSTHSISVPYIKPMLIGRTFDVSKSIVGGDIFEPSTIELQETKNYLSHTKYKMVNTKEKVRDVLDVSGQLSLQIMSGMINVKGAGRYLKETASTGNFVEVLVKISCRTVTKTIKNRPTTRVNWNIDPIGQHYVRGITYGGYLIASLKFEAKSKKSKESVEASVSGDFKNGGAGFSLEGQFNKLAEAASDISTLSISYTATAPLETVPTDISSLIKVINDFPRLVNKSTPGGYGVPIQAELLSLSSIDPADPKLKYLVDQSSITDLNSLNSQYLDLITTLQVIKKFTNKYPSLTDKGEEDLGKLYDKVFSTILVFNEAIANLDLRNGSSQFQKAIKAYRYQNKSWPGHFKSEFDILMTNKNQMIIPVEPAAYLKNGALYLHANQSYTEVVQAAKVRPELDWTKKEIEKVKNSVSGIEKLLSVYIKSEGCEDKGTVQGTCGYAKIQVNGKEYAEHKRGHNIVVVDPKTGNITYRAFDTHEHINSIASRDMVNFLDALPKRNIVIVAIQDDGSSLTEEGIASLRKLGGRKYISNEFRSSYALIGWNGPGSFQAVTEVRMKKGKGPSMIAEVFPLPI